MAKQLMFEDDARQQIWQGCRKLAAAVKVTLGPTGRNVILQKSYGSPAVTKDGVTVSKEIELPDPFENMGAKMVNEVASKTSDVAGDGTTTATVLAEAIYREGLKNVTAGANPMALKRGIDAGRRRRPSRASSSSRSRSRATTTSPRSARSAPTAMRRSASCWPRPSSKVGTEGVIEIEEGKSLADREGSRRGHAVRQGLHLALLHDQPRARSSACSRTPTS